MSLNIFIITFGTMLGIGSGLFIAISKMVANFKRYGKAPLLYLLGVSILIGIVLFLISYFVVDFFKINILFLLTQLVFGVLHQALMIKKFWAKRLENTLLSEILFIVAIMLFSSVVFAVMHYLL